MSSRLDQTYALLRTFADWEPGLTTWTGSVVRSNAVAGEAAGRLELCQPCDGTGRAGRAACRFCQGAGRIAVDPQTGRQVTDHDTSFEQLVRRRRVRCDRCGGSGQQSASSVLEPGRRHLLESHEGRSWWRESDRDRCPECAGTGSVEIVDERMTDASLARTQRDWPQLADGDGHDPGWWLPAALERKQHQWVTGSYPELEQLLQRLHAEHPVRFRLVDRLVIHPDGSRPSDRVLITLDETVVYLADRMPWPIRVPDQATRDWADARVKQDVWRRRGHVHERVRAERDAQLKLDRRRGFEITELCLRYGLSRRRVYEILGETQPVATQVA